MTAMTEWLFGIIAFAAPLDRVSPDRQFPGFEESTEQRRDRYESIAADLERFTFDPDTKPVFSGDHGRARTAALLLSIAYHESGFAKDVDLGPCWRGKNGRSTRCDSGMSACLMQLHIGNGKTPEGYDQAALFADRTKCFRAGLRLVRGSFGACRALPLVHRLNAYASGSCERGHDASKALMDMSDRFVTHAKVPGKDSAFVIQKTP